MERVLQVIGGLNRAGAETMLMNLYRQLDKQKIQFDFLIYKPGKQDYEDEIIAAGGRVLRVSAGGIISPLQYIFKTMYVIRKYGPYKAIHIHTLHNGAWALLAALPFRETVRVMHSHSTANPKHGVVGRLYNTLTKFLIRICAEKCVACGNDSGEYLFGKRFHHEGIVIRNGVDVNKFRGSARDAKMAFCSRNHFAPDAMLITCIGRLHPVKNHSFAIKIAEESRPSLLAAKKMMDAAELNVRSSKRAFTPDIGAFGSYQHGGRKMDSDNGYQFGVELAYTNLNLMLLKKQVDEATATYRKYVADYEKARQDVYLDVKSAYINLMNSHDSIAVSKLALQQAKEQQYQAFRRYQVGLGDAIEFKDSENTYLNAQLDYYSTLLQYNINAAELERVIGAPIKESDKDL